MLTVIERTVGSSFLIEDVQLHLVYADPSSIVFSMKKLSGGRETKVRVQRNHLTEVCYNVQFQLLSIRGQTVQLALEHSESVSISLLDDGETFTTN